MSVIAINKDSYTEQVVKVLRHEIETGALPPLSKLPSTRTLAEKFGVSKSVILFALNELEKSRLIVRKARSGVYVSEMASNPDVLEVLIFVFAQNPARHAFVNRIMSIVSSTAAEGKINFYTRFVTLGKFKEHPQSYLLKLLKAEIAKLSHCFNPDCVMVIGPELSKAEVNECLKFPFPCMFMGNFKDGDHAGIKYNRIGFELNHYDFVADFAVEKSLKHIYIVAPDELNKSDVFHSSFDKMMKIAGDKNIGTSHVFIPNARHCDEDVRHKGMRKAAEQLKKEITDKSLVLFDCVREPAVMLEYMKENGVRIKPGKLELMLSVSCGEVLYGDGIHLVEYSNADVEKFNSFLCDKLFKLAVGRLDDFRFDYALDKTVRR